MVEYATDAALIGTWLLQSHRVVAAATGATSEPFGSKPSGVLLVGADGRMAALITPGTAPGRPGDTSAPPPLVAYSGHYRIASPGQFVTTVDVASIAPWVGTDQVRSYTVAGDRLELTTPATTASGEAAPMIATMVWVRETTTVASGGPSD